MFESLAGNASGGLFGLVGQALNAVQNVQLARLQNQFNIDMWNRNNEYNSPQAQMQRFKDAGLNPNLIYSQGSPGLSSAPPQMHAPQPVEMSKPMQELGKAFNIENLKTLIANRKKAEADAESANTDAKRNDLQFQAENLTGLNYTYNYSSGKWEKRPTLAPNEVRVVHPASYYMNRIFENNYNRAHLIPIKERLYEPEIWMRNYDKEYYPVSYWIGQGTRAVHGASEVVGMFMPSKWAKPLKFQRDPIRWRNPWNQPIFAPDTY